MAQSDIAAVRAEWMASEIFKGRADPTSLDAPREQRKYLVNRLVNSFEDGVVAGMKIAEARIAKSIHREIFQ